ncbi:MAG: hypothetical protein U0792_08760 [Gemmataceae bacterium]
MRVCAIALVLCLGTLAIAEEKSVVREIPTKDLKLGAPERGRATEPTTIASAEDLAKSPLLKDAAEAIGKQVDFKAEKLLVFAWAGSGQDKITLTAKEKDGKKVLTLEYTPGLTRDLRRHVKLFAVPKDIEIAK